MKHRKGSLANIYHFPCQGIRKLSAMVLQGCRTGRPLHSPSLVAVGLSVAFHWLGSPFHHWFIKYRSNIDCDCISRNAIWAPMTLWEFPLFFWGHWQSPCTTLTAGKCLPSVLCKETVEESIRLVKGIHQGGGNAHRSLQHSTTPTDPFHN